MSNIGDGNGEVMEEGKYEVQKTTGSEYKVEFKQRPSQDEFVEFGRRHGQKVTDLQLILEYDEEVGDLDFAALGKLPELERLQLECVNTRSLVFNEQNAPKLQHIGISNVNVPFDGDLRLDLALPELSSFSAEYTVLQGEENMFGLSMSRCPKLANIHSYKFRNLTGQNFMVLPECSSLELYRCECTEWVTVLRAPGLYNLSVRAAYDLQNVRLYDLPDATVQDVEALCRGEMTLKQLLRRSAGKTKEPDLPGCVVNVVNMDLNAASKRHLRANPRVQFCENEEDDTCCIM